MTVNLRITDDYSDIYKLTTNIVSLNMKNSISNGDGNDNTEIS